MTLVTCDDHDDGGIDGDLITLHSRATHPADRPGVALRTGIPRLSRRVAADAGLGLGADLDARAFARRAPAAGQQSQALDRGLITAPRPLGALAALPVAGVIKEPRGTGVTRRRAHALQHAHGTAQAVRSSESTSTEVGDGFTLNFQSRWDGWPAIEKKTGSCVFL
jgi:hypothetical protein